MQNITDERLLELIQSNPEDGIALLMDEYMGLLHNACSRYLDNPEDIRECVQETLVDFYVHLDRFDPEKGSLKSWLYLIAWRKAYRMAVKNSRYTQLPQDELEASMVKLNTGEDWEEQAAERALLEDALAELKPEYSQIVRMKYFEGKTCAEIARELDLPLETVKKRQQRSLKKLRRILIAVLILAMLTACTVFVEYHFRFGESTGLQEEGETWYQMEDGPILLETEESDVWIQSVVWKEGKIIIRTEFMNPELESDSYRVGLYSEERTRLKASHSFSARMDRTDGVRTEIVYYYYQPTEEVALDILGEMCIIQMEPVSQYESIEDIGTVQSCRGRSIALRQQNDSDGSYLMAYVHSSDDWEISDLGELMTLEPDWEILSLNKDRIGFRYADDESDWLDAETFIIPKVSLQYQGESVDIRIPVPETSVKVNLPFEVGGDLYRITEISRVLEDIRSRGTSSLGVYEEDDLFIAFEPVKLESNTKIYAMQVDLGYMENTDSGKERFHSVSGYWPSSGFFTQIDGEIQLTDPVISKAVQNPDEDLKPEMILRIHSVAKIWEQEYQFQLK